MLFGLGLLVTCLLYGVCSDSCSGRCRSDVDFSKSCHCDKDCVTYNDCCSDYQSLCLSSSASCAGRCETRVDKSKDCQCNAQCSNYKDCCSDYLRLCSASGSGPSDITTIANELWKKDVNRVSDLFNTLHFQGHTSTSDKKDLAPNRLFPNINEADLLNKPTYRAFINLLDNYDHNSRNTEKLTSAEKREIDHFLDTILETEVMGLTEQFLRNNNRLSNSRGAFKGLLSRWWFDLYKRTSRGNLSSSGFEHVFVGETKSSKVSGFHSWVQFYLEEKAGNLDYKGYVSKAQPGLIGAHFTWHGGLWKALGSFFVGTSPEFDMAIYTICFMMKPNSACRFKINNHDVGIQTYDNSNWPGRQIATAFPL